jgi:hypothetical protein
MPGRAHGLAARIAALLTAVLAVAAVAVVPASGRLRVAVNEGARKLRIVEETAAADALVITWDRATAISRFTNPAGLDLFIPGGDPAPGHGGVNGCDQLSPTEVACGYLPHMFSSLYGNLFVLGAGNDLLRVDPLLPTSDDYAVIAKGVNVDAGPGRDRVYATDFYDFLVGGRGADRLFGRGDADEIHGCRGNDLLHGGGAEGPSTSQFPKYARTNSLWGGLGRDRFKGKTIRGYRLQDKFPSCKV